MEDQVKCVKCGNTLEEGQEFCPKCGTPRDGKEKVCCSKCGAEIKEGQDFCTKCGQRVSEEPAAHVTEVTAAKPKSKKGMIAVCAVIAVAVVCTAAFLFLRNSTPKGPDFFQLNDEYGNILWSKAGDDGSYLTIDTNPFDVEDKGIAYPLAYMAVENINAALGLPESFINDIKHTTGADGLQSQVFEEQGINVSWKYNPTIGLELSYKLIDPADAPRKKAMDASYKSTDELRMEMLKEYIDQTHDSLLEDYGIDITMSGNTFNIVYTETEIDKGTGSITGVYTHTVDFQYTIGEKKGNYIYTQLQEVYQKDRFITDLTLVFESNINADSYVEGSSISVNKYIPMLNESQQSYQKPNNEHSFEHMMRVWNEVCFERIGIPIGTIGFHSYR